MTKIRVSCFGVSLDGFGAGPDQDLNNPLGVGGQNILQWAMDTRTFQNMMGDGSIPGTTGVDDEFAIRGFQNVGAWILGRNMFGPVRGPWPNNDWKGWWGTNPPYHVPVFVLTHHARAPITMKGGTVFHFVTEGIHAALDQAKTAAKEKDVRLGGGVSTLRQYLQARLIDELHLAIRPIVLGAGENLWAGLDMRALGYEATQHLAGERALHVTLRRA